MALWIILGVLIAGAGVYFYFYKTGKINDRDGDYIPDEVEDAVEDVKERYTDRIIDQPEVKDEEEPTGENVLSFRPK